LQKKGVKFEWTPKCEESFQKLKDILTSEPILKIIYPNEYFVVCVDACKEGLSIFLTQKYHVFCYESKRLKEHERNYSTHEFGVSINCSCIKNVDTLPNGSNIRVKNIPLVWTTHIKFQEN
jgi:hypothetical protein